MTRPGRASATPSAAPGANPSTAPATPVVGRLTLGTGILAAGWCF